MNRRLRLLHTFKNVDERKKNVPFDPRKALVISVLNCDNFKRKQG